MSQNEKTEQQNQPLTADEIRGIMRDELAGANFMTADAVERLVDEKMDSKAQAIEARREVRLAELEQSITRWIESVANSVRGVEKSLTEVAKRIDQTILPAVSRAEGMLSNFTTTIETVNTRMTAMTQDITSLEEQDRAILARVNAETERGSQVHNELATQITAAKNIALTNQRTLVGDKTTDGPKSVLAQLASLDNRITVNNEHTAAAQRQMQTDFTALKQQVQLDLGALSTSINNLQQTIERSQWFSRFVRWVVRVASDRYSSKIIAYLIASGTGLGVLYEVGRDKIMKIITSLFVLVLLLGLIIVPVTGYDGETTLYPPRAEQLTWKQAPSYVRPVGHETHDEQEADKSAIDYLRPKQSTWQVDDGTTIELTNDNPITYIYVAIIALLGFLLVARDGVIAYAMRKLSDNASPQVVELVQKFITSAIEEGQEFAESTPTPFDDAIIDEIAERVLAKMRTPETMADAIYNPPAENEPPTPLTDATHG